MGIGNPKIGCNFTSVFHRILDFKNGAGFLSWPHFFCLPFLGIFHFQRLDFQEIESGYFSWSPLWFIPTPKPRPAAARLFSYPPIR